MQLYIHVPFCARACPYCDFDFAVGRAPDLSGFMAGLQQEFDLREDIAKPQTLETIYIGGGTPSLLGGAGLAKLLEWVSARFVTANVREWTVELNPEHVTEELLACLATCGVTRVSLGVQSLSARGLRQLGRVHSEEQAERATGLCKDSGLSTSVDLIVGWPEQTDSELEHDCRKVCELGVNHASVYALTIEAQTPWPKLVKRGKRSLPRASEQAKLLLLAEQLLTSQGFEHYEISNYARAGQQSVHNSGYWNAKPYIGIGPSAHSAFFAANGQATRRGNLRGFSTWLSAPQIHESLEVLNPEDAAVESLWLGLRQLSGIHVPTYLQRFPHIDEAWLHKKIARQLQLGNLMWDPLGVQLFMAPTRWLWHDAIGTDLL